MKVTLQLVLVLLLLLFVSIAFSFPGQMFFDEDIPGQQMQDNDGCYCPPVDCDDPDPFGDTDNEVT